MSYNHAYFSQSFSDEALTVILHFSADFDVWYQARYVLLKGHDDRGFVWYTNYNSRKGGELEVNNNAALTFWWGEMERSIRIEGSVEKVSEEEATAYFHSRPRSSQIGAWSSNQSREIENRTALEEQEVEIAKAIAEIRRIGARLDIKAGAANAGGDGRRDDLTCRRAGSENAQQCAGEQSRAIDDK